MIDFTLVTKSNSSVQFVHQTKHKDQNSSVVIGIGLSDYFSQKAWLCLLNPVLIYDNVCYIIGSREVMW